MSLKTSQQILRAIHQENLYLVECRGYDARFMLPPSRKMKGKTHQEIEKIMTRDRMQAAQVLGLRPSKKKTRNK